MVPTTQITLLKQIQLHDDHRSWQTFYELYQPVIRTYALSLGIQESDVDDLQQEVFQVIAKEISQFEYDHNKGRFSSWVYQITRNRTLMAFRKNRKQRKVKELATTESIIHRDFEEENPSLWKQLLNQSLFEAASAAVQKEVKASTWQAFWKLTVEGQDISQVAESLDLTKGNIYVAKSRVSARLKHHMELLDG